MIRIENLTFGYKKQAPLYNSLSLELNGGSVVGLLGKNGAGKTTLLKLVTGLLQDHKEGTIQTLGFSPKAKHPDMLKEIFFIPEEFELPSVSIKDYLNGAKTYYPRFDEDRMNKILDEFELDNKKKLTKMSYGQKKKFLIAMALSSGCKLLIFDEPTNGLDIPSKALFRKVTAGALNENQLMIISTHQVKDIESVIDTILIVDQGKVIINKCIYDITSDYSFYTRMNTEEFENIIYKERVPEGYKMIVPREAEETDLDIESFFNAITQGIIKL